MTETEKRVLWARELGARAAVLRAPGANPTARGATRADEWAHVSLSLSAGVKKPAASNTGSLLNLGGSALAGACVAANRDSSTARRASSGSAATVGD